VSEKIVAVAAEDDGRFTLQMAFEARALRRVIQ
jgi:hypothetical protein